MRVLVDTCIWSYVLRRKRQDAAAADRLREIVREGRLAIIGPIRQEILSGISAEAQFLALKERLAHFEDIPLMPDHFIRAAEFCNVCMRKGVQGSNTDFLICAVANEERLAIFTSDKDFVSYRKHLPIRLFEIP